METTHNTHRSGFQTVAIIANGKTWHDFCCFDNKKII